MTWCRLEERQTSDRNSPLPYLKNAIVKERTASLFRQSAGDNFKIPLNGLICDATKTTPTRQTGMGTNGRRLKSHINIKSVFMFKIRVN